MIDTILYQRAHQLALATEYSCWQDSDAGHVFWVAWHKDSNFRATADTEAQARADMLTVLTEMYYYRLCDGQGVAGIGDKIMNCPYCGSSEAALSGVCIIDSKPWLVWFCADCEAAFNLDDLSTRGITYQDVLLSLSSKERDALDSDLRMLTLTE